jgi:hypothetical protein
MAKVKTGEKKQYEKILDLFQSMGSDTLMVAEIKEKLGDEIKMYRLSTYMYDIKKYSKQAIVPIREGKKVMGYKLVKMTVPMSQKITGVALVPATVTEVADEVTSEVETE